MLLCVNNGLHSFMINKQAMPFGGHCMLGLLRTGKVVRIITYLNMDCFFLCDNWIYPEVGL